MVAVRRPRNRHRMLAVEPLAQASTPASSKLLGVIIEAFHPGASAEDKKKLKDRAWSRFMLRRTSASAFQSLFVSSGCSLIVSTMILRYLRVPADGGFETVYDKVIGAMIDAKSFEEKFAPREFLYDNARSIKAAASVYSGNKNKKARKALQAHLDANGLSTDPDFFGVDFKSETLADTSTDGQKFVKPATLAEHSHYPPVMVLWYIRQKQKSDDTYDVEVLTARKQVLKEVDGTTKLELEPVTFKENKTDTAAKIVRPSNTALDSTDNTYYATRRATGFR